MERSPNVLSAIEESMERLRQALADPKVPIVRKAGLLIEAYAVHGSPFGESIEAAFLWDRYRQQTTRN